MGRVLLTALLIACTAVAAEADDAAGKVTISIATQAPEQSVWGKTLDAVAKEVGDTTGGKVKLRIFYGGVQGDERTVLRKLRAGQLQGAAFLGQGLTEVCPSSLVANLPLMFRDEPEVEYVLERVLPRFEEESRGKGYEIVGWARIGFSYLFSQDPVRDVDTLRRGKPWLIEDDVLMRNLYDVLGVTPIPASVTDVLPALQSGLLRTIFSPPFALIAQQWHTRVKYRLDLHMTFALAGVVISDKTWSKLSPEFQDAVRKIIAERFDEMDRKVATQNKEALDELEKRGIETLTIDPSALEAFEKANVEVCERLGGKELPKEALAFVQQVLAEYRAAKKPEPTGGQ